MLNKVIAGWTISLGAPKNWDAARDGGCGNLPVRVVGERGRDDGYCESAWEPTPRELGWLNAGGQLVLRVHGWQVPVALYVEPPPAEYEDVAECEKSA